MAHKLFEVLIVGGGPAGLAAATAVARQVRSAVVFDSGVYRNAATAHMHVVPTWDHQNPADFRAKAREDLRARYPLIQFADVAVESIKKSDEDRFALTDANGKEWLGRKVILATGSKDVFPKIEGYAECWGKGIFHCMFCHGYEERDSTSAGVLAVDMMASPMIFHVIPMVGQMTKSLTIYTNGSSDLDAMHAEKAPKMKVPSKLDKRVISKLEKHPEGAKVTIHFENGESVTEDFIAHSPLPIVHGNLAEQLGLEMADGMFPGVKDIKTTPPFNQTSVRGVFAAGDCSTPMKTVLTALQLGAAAGAGVAMQLGEDGV